MDLIAYIDGGSRGNPGPSAIGIVLQDRAGNVLFEIGEFIGQGTNNEAEYKALIRLLEIAATNPLILGLKAKSLNVRCDSNLIVQQVSGNWKIKEPRLQELYNEVQRKKMFLRFDLRIKYVPREENAHADRMVNQALDAVRVDNDSAQSSLKNDGFRF